MDEIIGTNKILVLMIQTQYQIHTTKSRDHDEKFVPHLSRNYVF
jgi:hypothetical protein